MSDHGTQHHHDEAHSTEIKSKTSFQSSFWLVLILVGLFIGAVNFISVMGHEEGGHGTEQSHGAPAGHGGGHDAAGHEGTGHEAAGHEAAGHPADGHSAEEHHQGSNNAHNTGSADPKEGGSEHH